MAINKKQKPVVIEFLGIPGAGKSTIAKELINHLINSGYKVADYSDAKKYIQLSSTRRKKLSWLLLLLANIRLVAWLFKFRPLNLRYRLGHLLDALWIEKQLTKTTFAKFDYVIVDQGASQALSAVLDTSKYNTEHAVTHFLNKAYDRKEKLLITCFLDSKSAYKRLKYRSDVYNQGKLDNLKNIDEIKLMYHAISYNIEQITNWVKCNGYNVLELDTNYDAQFNAKIICDQVLRKKNGFYEY